MRMVEKMREQLFSLTILFILVLVCDSGEKCSYDISSQQACDFMANITNGDLITRHEEIYHMVKFVYTSLNQNLNSNTVELTGSEDQDGLFDEFPKASHMYEDASDDELWDTMRQRQRECKVQFQELGKKCSHLQTRYEELSRRNTKHQVSTRRLQNRYRTCQALRMQLLKNVTNLSTYGEDLEHALDLAAAELDKKSADLNALEKQDMACQQKFSVARTILSQMLGPSPEDNYVPTTNLEADVELNNMQQRLTYFTDNIDKKQKTIDILTQRLEQLQSEYDNLRIKSADQLAERELQRDSCLKEAQTWQEKFNEEKNKSRLLKDEPVICLNKVSADFCSLELTDLAHNETCWFERVQPTDYNWRVVSELRKKGYTKTLTDHTCSSSNGRFLHVDLSRLMNGQQARLITHPFQSETEQCFSFWYNIGYSFNYGKFYAVVIMRGRSNFWRGNSLQVWRQNLISQEEWQFSSFGVPAHVARDGYRIQLVAESNGPGYVALDDVALANGPCPR